MNKKILYPMDNESKRLFFLFLARHGALTKYKWNRNIYVQKKSHEIDPITSKKTYISNAFTWRITPEGYEYWQHLSQLWYDIVTKLI